jgi:histone deacetylase complex regulatory component SIN3
MTINNIVSLFGENYDLIETFNTFLPNKWQITSTNSNFDSQTPAQTTIFSNQTLASTSGSNTTTTSTNLQKTSPSTTSLQNKIPNHDACKQCAQQLLEMIQVSFDCYQLRLRFQCYS